MTENARATPAVVGGGPAGMMAAIYASYEGAQVTLYEPNSMLGKKLRITGKGRCNVTNNCPPDEFLKHVAKNAKFLYSALYKYTPEDAMSFFEALGVPLKTERGRRVFPESDKASDIAGALASHLADCGVRVRREKVERLIIENGRAVGVVTRKGEYRHSAVIVATGGASYPLTGSTGDGYRFAREAGIPVSRAVPSLVPFETKEDFSFMSGLSLKNVKLSVTERDSGKIIFSEQGEMLFTHFGVSGPLVLSASSYMTGKAAAHYAMSIDLKPALTREELDARILSDFAKYAHKDFINALDDLLPQKLIGYIVKLSEIPPRIKVSSVTREMRARLLDLLKALPVTPVRTRPIAEAIVTSGGVEVSALSPRTMESLSVKGLYFAGEVIDVDARTGGYNLQIAYSTGVLAGISASLLPAF